MILDNNCFCITVIVLRARVWRWGETASPRCLACTHCSMHDVPAFVYWNDSLSLSLSLSLPFHFIVTPPLSSPLPTPCSPLPLPPPPPPPSHKPVPPPNKDEHSGQCRWPAASITHKMFAGVAETNRKESDRLPLRGAGNHPAQDTECDHPWKFFYITIQHTSDTRTVLWTFYVTYAIHSITFASTFLF